MVYKYNNKSISNDSLQSRHLNLPFCLPFTLQSAKHFAFWFLIFVSHMYKMLALHLTFLGFALFFLLTTPPPFSYPSTTEEEYLSHAFDFLHNHTSIVVVCALLYHLITCN